MRPGLLPVVGALLVAAAAGAADHRGLGCADCHTGDPPAAANARCAGPGCHPDLAGAFATTAHDRRHLADLRPRCPDCHGDHRLRTAAEALARACGAQVGRVCAPCHPVQRYGVRPLPGDGGGVHERARAERGCSEASISCFACHGAHHVRPASDPASPIHPRRIAATCGRCHRPEAAAYARSVHARALAIRGIPAPSCVACHGAHGVRAPEDREAPVSRRKVVYTCAECHEDPAVLRATALPLAVVDSYEETFHGIAYRQGITDVATCPSCHGAHDVRPVDDPRSRVGPRRVRETCRACHGTVDEAMLERIRHPRRPGGLGAALRNLRLYYPVAGTAANPLVVSGLGALVGFLSGVFGVGGGFLMTPLLIFIGIPAAVAAATDSAQITAGAASGAVAHSRMGNVDFRMGLVIVGGGFVGGWAGVRLVRALRDLGNFDFALKLAYVAILAFTGGIMLVEGYRALTGPVRVGEPAPPRLGRAFRRLPLRMEFPRSGLETSALLPAGAGFLVGVLAAFLGVGGGFIMLPAMIYLIGIPTRIAVGTSLFQIVLICANVTVQQAVTNHTVDVLLAVTLFVGSTVGAQLGALASRRLRGEQIRILLGVVVVAVMLVLLRQLVVRPEQLIQFARSGGGH